MKKICLLFLLTTLMLGTAFAQHFVPITDPSASFFPGQVYITDALINGAEMEAGDEIGVFDGDMCVGMTTLTGPVNGPPDAYAVYAVYNGPDEPGAMPGNFIYLRIWDNSAQAEYRYPEMSVEYAMAPTWAPGPQQEWTFTFLNGGTTPAAKIMYNTPVATDTHVLTPPTGPGGGYVTDVAFVGTGLTLESGYVVAGGGGSMTINAFDEPSTDQYYQAIADDTTSPILGGTVPVEDFTNYGWYIDWDGTFYAAANYPIVFSINLNDVLPEGYTMDTETVGIYRRDIHGTAYYYEVDSSYDPVTNTITFSLYDPADVPGEFILTGIIEEPPLPVELTAFSALMSNTLGAVNLTWVTQSEENLAGFRVYRGNNDVLAEAADQNTLIPATNTSQTAMYQFSDPEIQAGQIYYYWLEAQEMNGVGQYYGPVSITTPTDASNAPQIPLETGLAALYPNPFNPDLTIRYGLQTPTQTEIYITNTKGQLVKTIHSGHREAGFYTYLWDGRDNLGRQCSSGLYLIRMQAGKQSFTRKAILAK